MANNKKDYLFRFGPFIFFPKDAEPKPTPYMDTSEEMYNGIRLAIIVLYGMVAFYLAWSPDVGSMFIERRPNSHYVIFIMPLGFSLMDLYQVWREKKTGIPMKKLSKIMIYGAWLVSAWYYGIYIYHFLFA
jgi:hypothetical protein